VAYSGGSRNLNGSFRTRAESEDRTKAIPAPSLVRRTKAIPALSLVRLFGRDDLAIREKCLWRLLSKTAPVRTRWDVSNQY